jgi:hypothetical protein
MFETLFGEGQYGLKMVFAIIVVLGLIALTAWLVRRFGSERLGSGTARGRQPRLAVIDAASVDGRRRLVLIRRDNVEHLMMIGGPSDVVIESNIVRAAPPAREAPRPASAPDTLPRPVPLGEGSMWPLQPEPAPAPPPVREAAPRRARAADPLAGLAEELARTPVPAPDQGNGDARAPRREARPARPQPPVAAPAPPPPMPPAPPAPSADPAYNAQADQNLAEMAQRLEAALRRPAKAAAEEARAPEPAPAAPAMPAEPEEPRQGARAPARAADKPAAKSSLYDSLEQEMASLLGRPNKP